MEAAVVVEPRRVGAGSDRLVDLVHRQVLGECNSTRTREIQDLEGSQVDHASVLTQVHVFGIDDGGPPAVVPLDFALAQAVLLEQISIAAVPMWAFPHPGGEVLGASGVGDCLEA